MSIVKTIKKLLGIRSKTKASGDNRLRVKRDVVIKIREYAHAVKSGFTDYQSWLVSIRSQYEKLGLTINEISEIIESYREYPESPWNINIGDRITVVKETLKSYGKSGTVKDFDIWKHQLRVRLDSGKFIFINFRNVEKRY